MSSMMSSTTEYDAAPGADATADGSVLLTRSRV